MAAAKKKKRAKPETPGPRSIYLGKVYTDIQQEATRLRRSVSWLIREAWTIAGPTIRALPPHNTEEEDDEPSTSS